MTKRSGAARVESGFRRRGSGWLSLVTDWAALRDVYGSAADIPALLRDAAATADWNAVAWQELWQRLYHQGSVSPASYAALPALAKIAASRTEVALDPALFLLAAIIASDDAPSAIDGARSVYAAELAALRPVAEGKVALVRDRADVLWALEVVAALEDLSPWQRDLDRLANDEVELECPSCGDYIYLGLVDGALVATTGPDAVPDGQRVQQAPPSDLGPAEARLVTLSEARGHPDVAREMLQFFGRAGCPHCGTWFPIPDALP